MVDIGIAQIESHIQPTWMLLTTIRDSFHS